METKIRKVSIQLNNTELLKGSNPFSTNVPHLYFYKNGILVEIVSMVNSHCVKSVHIRSYSGPHFPAFGLNTDQKKYEYGHFSRSVRITEEILNGKLYFLYSVLVM